MSRFDSCENGSRNFYLCEFTSRQYPKVTKIHSNFQKIIRNLALRRAFRMLTYLMLRILLTMRLLATYSARINPDASLFSQTFILSNYFKYMYIIDYNNLLTNLECTQFSSPEVFFFSYKILLLQTRKDQSHRSAVPSGRSLSIFHSFLFCALFAFY